MIRSEDVAFWQDVANKRTADYPHVGRKVTIVEGRKHKGKIGIVRQHRRDQYSDAFRYGNDASHHMRDMAGRYGFIVQVDTGTERFWVKASYCLCDGRDCTPEQNYKRWCRLTEKKAKELGRSLTQEEEMSFWREVHDLNCPSCLPSEGAVNHVPGHVFVGWGHGWQPCFKCGGSGFVAK